MDKTPQGLRFQIELLKFEIDQQKRRADEEISLLNEEKKCWAAISSKKSESQINEQLMQYQKTQADGISKQQADSQKEISLYKLHIGELQKLVSKKQAKNANLVTDNVSLHQECDVIQGKVDTVTSQTSILQPKFEKGMSSFIQTKINNHTATVKQMNSLNSKLQNIGNKLNKIILSMEDKTKNIIRNQRDITKREEIIRQLEKVLLDLSGLPNETAPDPKEFLYCPDKVINFVDNAGEAIKRDSRRIERQYQAYRKSTMQSMTEQRRPPLSRDVVKLITQVGNTVVSLSEEYSNSHQDSSDFYSYTIQ